MIAGLFITTTSRYPVHMIFTICRLNADYLLLITRCCRWLWAGLFLFGIALSTLSVAGNYISQPLPKDKTALTLLDAIQLALQKNPDLAIFAKEIHVLKGVALQAGLLPNPQLRINLDDLGTATSNTPGGTSLSIRIGQLIETGGKRLARETVATFDMERAIHDFEARRLNLIAQVANLFTDVLASQSQQQLAEESVKLAKQVATTVIRRVQAGKAPPIEQTKAKVALATVKIEQEQVLRNLTTLRKQLALLWGNSYPEFTHVSGDLESMVVIPQFNALIKRMHANPTVLRGQANLAQREENLKLQQARRLPDITLSAGIRQYHQKQASTTLRDTTALVGISVPLPIFDRNQGNILAAHQQVNQAIDQREATDLRLRGLLIQAYEALRAAHNEVTLLRDEILPGVRSIFTTARKGYELGKFNLLTVFDAQRTLFKNQALYVHALANYQHLVNEIERLIAAPIESVSK